MRKEYQLLGSIKKEYLRAPIIMKFGYIPYIIYNIYTSTDTHRNTILIENYFSLRLRNFSTQKQKKKK